MKKLLLAVLMMTSVSGAAMAVEITHPFYTPAQKKFLSTTDYTFGRTTAKVEGTKSRYLQDQMLREEIAFGITDAFTVYVGGQNDWLVINSSDEKSRSDNKVLSWNAGTSYTFDQKGLFARGRVDYSQTENNDLVDFKGAYKAFTLKGTVGYDVGLFLPYIDVTAEIPTFQSKFAANNPYYDTYVGAYKLFGKMVATDVGFNFGFDDNGNNRDWTAKARVDYIFTPKVSAGVYGDYMFYGRNPEDTKYHGYKVGLNLKATF